MSNVIALAINDLEVNKELDRAALAKVVGGWTVSSTGGWTNITYGSKIYSSWKYDFWKGKYYRSFKQYRYGERKQEGYDLYQQGRVYA